MDQHRALSAPRRRAVKQNELNSEELFHNNMFDREKEMLSSLSQSSTGSRPSALSVPTDQYPQPASLQYSDAAPILTNLSLSHQPISQHSMDRPPSRQLSPFPIFLEESSSTLSSQRDHSLLKRDKKQLRLNSNILAADSQNASQNVSSRQSPNPPLSPNIERPVSVTSFDMCLHTHIHILAFYNIIICFFIFNYSTVFFFLTNFIIYYFYYLSSSSSSSSCFLSWVVTDLRLSHCF
jgi:hypothetical protein